MDFKQLVYLDAIDRHRNLTKAARELYMTQPALSSFLQNAEQELHTELFRWNGRRMYPTPAGEEVLAFARQVLAEKKQLDQRLGVSLYGQRVLRVGVPFSRTEEFLATLVAFDRAYPQMEIVLEESSYKTLNDRLADCRLDLIFTNDPAPAPGFVCVPIRREELLLYVSPLLARPQAEACGFSAHPRVQLSALADCRFLLPPAEQMLGAATRAAFAEYGFAPRQTFAVSNVAAELRLAKMGYGACLYPAHLLARDPQLAAGTFAFGEHAVYNQFSALYARQMRHPEMVQAFIRTHLACAGQAQP